jgi:phosphopantetheine adenylyltransferase
MPNKLPLPKNYSTFQKTEIANTVYNFIALVCNKPYKHKMEVLPSLAAFFKSSLTGELLLKQLISKSTMPRHSWPKGEILKVLKVSNRIIETVPKEHSDVRHISEVITANEFLERDINGIIQIVTFKPEKPSIGVVSASRGNTYKDAVFDVELSSASNLSIAVDIKAGNNGTTDFFNGSLCPLPLIEDNRHYTVLNSNEISLEFLQEQRLNHLLSIKKTINNFTYEKHLDNINTYMNSSLDALSLNDKIQYELLHCISLKVLQKQPSFFAPYKAMTAENLNLKFYKKIEAQINPTIFQNKENFNLFMQQALKVYNEDVESIAKNLESSFWKDTGFGNIGHDVFL